MSDDYLLSIDQGTTSSRAQIYDTRGSCLSTANQELTQYYPKDGWVEHDPEEIWRSVVAVVTESLAAAKVAPDSIRAIGLTNQRETALLWERATGKTLGEAIVWQDRRTATFCKERAGEESWIRDRTGLVLDPYFSATKLRWLLDRDPSLRRRAESGELCGSTVDSFLLHRLSGTAQYLTDRTNASRTLLLDLETGNWDKDLCKFFDIPEPLLPEVRASASSFGTTSGLDCLPDGIPITGIAGDQQAALFGHGALEAGTAKCTYGTGAFFLRHLGSNCTRSKHRLLTSWAAGTEAQAEYVLEGSVFVAGAAVQWLRDGLRVLASAPEIERLATDSDPEQPILFVPGFVGLGAPHWIPEARGVLFGLNRATTTADLGRATLEGVAYQINDLVDAVNKDTGSTLTELRVDGGMTQNAWFLRFQSDILGANVLRSTHSEVTARGAALLAGLGVGLWKDAREIQQLPLDFETFEPCLEESRRSELTARWHRAVRSVIDFYSSDQNT